MAPLSIKDPGSHWTSEIRDEKLQTLLDRKQDDAENAKILIDLLENGVFRADASADSDSDEDGDDGVEGDIDGLPRTPLDEDDMDSEFVDSSSMDDNDPMLSIPISASRPLRSTGQILTEPSSRDNRPVQAIASGPGLKWMRRLGAPRHGFGGSAQPPVIQQAPPTVYEVIEVMEAPQLGAERVADVETVLTRPSIEREVDIPVPSLEEEEREVRELERRLQEKKARMEEIRRQKKRPDNIHNLMVGSGSAWKALHRPGFMPAVAVQSAHRRGWFSRLKSRFGRLFSRSGPGDKKKDRERDLPDSNKPTGEELVGQHDLISPIINNLVVVNNNIASPNGMQDTPPANKPTPPPPKISASEALLRTKIFAPHTLALMTTLPEPTWATPMDPTGITTLFSPTATPLTCHTLVPQGQFIAQRQRDVTDALSKIELGLGVTGPGGIGVNTTATGILGLLKPYQWINMWRGTKRDIYVASSTPEKDPKGEEVDMDALHALENELISPAKYHFGESEFLTVITHSRDVNSGAVALFRASLVDGLATRLTLKARFKDVPREICKILRKGVKPNRYELTRAGSALKCSKEGGEGVLPPCLAVVERDGEEGWEGVGGGWRRALRIVLGEGDETGPREGLVATVPQMLAFLHLTHRVVDYVPSTPVFSFEPPLVGMTDDGACRVRRGTKLLGQPGGAVHVGEEVTISVLFSRESRWVREQLLWA